MRSDRGERHEPTQGAAMSFAEIASELGTTPSNVRNLYVNAMQKLRRRPGMLRKVRELAEARRLMRHG
jgi:DNA-directed RNA polymerase sigma subunit (sigma70/sigma32)